MSSFWSKLGEDLFFKFIIYISFLSLKTDDLRTIAMTIFDTFPCLNKEQLIIITQNKDDVLCFMRSKRIAIKQNVPKIDKDEIVDTIGGGDAFAGNLKFN